MRSYQLRIRNIKPAMYLFKVRSQPVSFLKTKAFIMTQPRIFHKKQKYIIFLMQMNLALH